MSTSSIWKRRARRSHLHVKGSHMPSQNGQVILTMTDRRLPQMRHLLQMLCISAGFFIISLLSVSSALAVRNTQLQRKLDHVPTIVCTPEAEWVQLSGEWVATYYGTETDGLLGERTGADWNGYECDGIPGEVTRLHYGIAMPGAEFYCLQVKVCINDECVETVAVDVMADDRLHIDGRYYNHIDLWPRPAMELGIIDAGIVTDDVKVYVR